METVFEASVRILKGIGKARFSTRSVAELAGISVGSLYQYFPNKEALIGALIEREAKRHVAMLEKRYEAIRDEPFEQLTRALIRELLEVVRRDRALLKAILTSTFGVDRLDSIIEAREHMIRFIADVLRRSGAQLGLERPELQAYAIVAALGGVVEVIIFRKSEPVSVDELVEETCLMVCRYCGAR